MITTTIAIVENRMIYLEGISCMLNDNDCSVILTTSSLPLLKSALNIATNYPDICLFNLSLLTDEGTAAIASIRRQSSQIKIMGYYIEETYKQRASVADLDGLFSLNEQPDDIMVIIKSLVASC